MRYQIPSHHDVQEILRRFRQAELREIGNQSGVPFPTIMKIRQGVTRNPGLETVRSILAAPFIAKAIKPKRHQATPKEAAHG